MRHVEIVQFGEHDTAAARQAQRRAARGSLVRLAPGRFVDAADWETLNGRERHAARVRAVTPRLDRRVIVSHVSAVMLHGLPWLGDIPHRVSVTDSRRSSSQRSALVDKHAGAERHLALVEIVGLPVTDLVGTAVDVALRYGRQRAIVVLDAVRERGVTVDELVDELDARPRGRANVRARWLIEFSTASSGSPGESITRLLLHDIGAPAPETQTAFHDDGGFIGRVDFWFPDERVIVEFDGAVKYRDPSMLAGRSPSDVVIAEKRREDRLRAHDERPGVTRLVWRDVMPGGGAPAILRAAGVHVRRGVDTTPPWR